MTLEIDPQYRKMYLLDKKKGSISLFTCPVEGCGWQTDQGPGALRMHILLKGDPKCEGRFCKEHKEYVEAHPETMKRDWVQYLASFPSALHGDTEIGHIKE
jgi:hypothetical protein